MASGVWGKLLTGRATALELALARVPSLLLADREKVARAFIEHLCTYALRRVLTFDDQTDLKAIEAEAKRSDYRIKDMIRAVALSNLINKR